MFENKFHLFSSAFCVYNRLFYGGICLFAFIPEISLDTKITIHLLHETNTECFHPLNFLSTNFVFRVSLLFYLIY